MSKRRRQRRLGVRASHKISNLPDSVFEDILSLLPLKQAVATCLSSKWWSHIRMSLPALDFEESNFHSLDHFLQYVDAVMTLRDDSETLKKFHLILRSKRRSSEQRNKINTQINNTALHYSKVENVEINDETFEFKIEIPSCIFNCNTTITTLKLSGVRVTTFPSFVDLPSLKVLHLSYVIFPDNKCIYNLLFVGCPLLQDLKLKHCGTTDTFSHVRINKQKLQNLVSADIYFYPFAMESLSSVTSLRIDTITHFQNPGPYYIFTDTFYNLIHMELRHLSPDPKRRQIFQCFQHFPKLETLIIHEYNCTEWWDELEVPQGVSSHLKEFHLGNYKGQKNEFRLARIIMETSSVLEIISIRFRDINSNKAKSKEEMIQRLSSCHIISENCRLLFK